MEKGDTMHCGRIFLLFLYKQIYIKKSEKTNFQPLNVKICKNIFRKFLENCL